MTMIYFIRHAQASFGAENYDALSPLGRRQSGAIGQALAERGFRPDIIFTGKMRRHRDTAALCMEELAMYPEIHALDGLNEYDFMDVIKAIRPELTDMAALRGAIERGENARLLFAEMLRAWAEHREDGRYQERFDAFIARVEDALGQIARRAAAREAQRVLVFTSGGPIGAIAMSLLGAPHQRFHDLTWRMANGAVTRVTLLDEPETAAPTPKLVSLNDFSALEAQPDLLTFW